jgi:hypothetical protein
LPDIEDRFWKKYRDQGLVVVAVDPGGRGGVKGEASTDDMAGLQQFCENLGVSFPVGLEMTTNYTSFTQNYKGANPFPVDIVVDKRGNIAYVAREYDPEGMAAVIEGLLAE